MNYLKVILLLLALTLAGCTTPLHVKFDANKHLNPDAANRSLPVEVIVYQLRDEQAFRQATFMELWQYDRSALGSSLLNRRELNLAPGAKTSITLNRDKETTYVGVVAIFLNPHGGHWRAIKKIGKGVPMTKKQIQVELYGNRLRIK